MSDTFDFAKGYKRLAFREDRDLLDSELNEMQEIAIRERRELLDRVFAPGSILGGLVATITGDTLEITEGLIYLDGHAVSVPGGSFTISGAQTIWADVFRRIVTVTEDPSLINPLTGEPTAEREKWIATLQARDTSGDSLPPGAIGRAVIPLLTVDAASGEVTILTQRPPSANDAARLDEQGGSIDE